MTQQYFKDLHDGAESIAKNHFSLTNSHELTGTEELLVWSIREHYIVYIPSQNQSIIIVALIRQSRDVPAILGKNRFFIERELKKLNDPR